MAAFAFMEQSPWYGGRSPVIEDYLQVGTAFNGREHREIDTIEQFNLVRERLVREGVENAERIGLVLFRDSGRMSIVYWVYHPDEDKGPGLFQELEPLPEHPGRTRPDGREPLFVHHRVLRHALRPKEQVMSELREARRQRLMERAKRNVEQTEARLESADVLRKTLGEDSAAYMMTRDGHSPVGVVDDEKVEQVREMAAASERRAVCTKPGPS